MPTLSQAIRHMRHACMGRRTAKRRNTMWLHYEGKNKTKKFDMSNKQMVTLTDNQTARAQELIKAATYFGRLTRNQVTELFDLWNEFAPVKKKRTTCRPCVQQLIDELKKLTA